MKGLSLEEAFKIVDSSLENSEGIKSVLSSMAIENMFITETFLKELIAVEQGQKTREQLRQETIEKYKK